MSVGELVLAVGAGLGRVPVHACPFADADADKRVAVDEVVRAVHAALEGCPDTCAAGEHIMRCRRPLNIAHRGGAALAPESTLAAFTNAVEIAADVLETDVHLTADGVVVCLHDPTVERTTDGEGAVADLTFAALATLDAGYRFTRDDGATFPFRGRGLRVPALDEVLALFPDQYFSIEIKPSDPAVVAPVLAVIDSRAMRGRAVVASFHTPVLEAVRRAAPDILTTMSLAEMATLNALTPAEEATYVPPARIVQAPVAFVTHRAMARAYRLGLIVQAWTVNDRPTMDALLAQDVHGIITNEPLLLRDAIAAAARDPG